MHVVIIMHVIVDLCIKNRLKTENVLISHMQNRSIIAYLINQFLFSPYLDNLFVSIWCGVKKNVGMENKVI